MFKKAIIYQNNDELMISNFEGMLKNGNLSNMFHFENWLGNKVTSKKRFFKRKFYQKLHKSWINCYNEYLRVFDFNDRQKRIMELEDKIALLKIKYHTTEKPQLKSLIAIKEKELAEMQTPEGKKKTFEEDLVMIQKYQGVAVKGNDTTVTRFFTYAKMMNDEAAKARAQEISNKLKNV